jgi:acyl phosphate:glycerol-3-phosphate acyltransferase
MEPNTILLLLLPVAYLLGSIPFGLLVGLSKGIDPRSAGSHNIGATNVGRLLGMKYFFYVFTLDMLKGLLPVALASYIISHHFPAATDRPALTNLLHLLVGFAAILGHTFSAFMGFKGGKAVSTSCGVALGLYPFFTLAGLAAIVVWLVVFYLWRYVSLASMTAAVAFPIVFIVIGRFFHWDVFHRQLPLLLFAILVALLIIVRHRANIARLRAGTESRFTGKAKAA